MGTLQNSILALVIEWNNPTAWEIRLNTMLLAAIYGVRNSKFSCLLFFFSFFFFFFLDLKKKKRKGYPWTMEISTTHVPHVTRGGGGGGGGGGSPISMASYFLEHF
jgi:hypothetical protein